MYSISFYVLVHYSLDNLTPIGIRTITNLHSCVLKWFKIISTYLLWLNWIFLPTRSHFTSIPRMKWVALKSFILKLEYSCNFTSDHIHFRQEKVELCLNDVGYTYQNYGTTSREFFKKHRYNSWACKQAPPLLSLWNN